MTDAKHVYEPSEAAPSPRADHRLSVHTDREPHCSWCDESWPCLTSRLAARVRALETEIESLRGFKRGVDEALNSGDGSYRP